MTTETFERQPITVLLDIDDTIADTQGAIMQYIQEHSDLELDYRDLTLEFRETGWVPDENSDSALSQYSRLVKAFLSDPSLIGAAEPFEDALAAVQKLHAHGVTVEVCSSRKENLHEVMHGWLNKHGFMEYVDKIHLRFSDVPGVQFKTDSANVSGAIAAFDDTYDVCEGLADHVEHVFMIKRPWNYVDGEHKENIVPCNDISHAVDRFIDQYNLAAA